MELTLRVGLTVRKTWWSHAIRGLLIGLVLLLGSLPSHAGTLRKVRVAYGVAAVDPSTAPWLSAAKTAGFWQAEGLDVEVVGFDGAGTALQLLANKQVDAVFTGTPNLFQLRERGVPIRAVANAYDRNHIYPVVPEESPIRTIEDFRGKRMGIQTLTGSILLWTRVLLASHGMSLRDLAVVIPVGTGATAVSALRNGQIDILAEWHGHYALLEEQFGLRFRKFDSDPSLRENAFVQAFFFHDDTIRNNPELVVGLLRGVAKAVIFADVNPAAAARGHFQQFPRTQPSGIPLEQAVAQTARVIKANVQLSTETAYERRWGYVSPQQVDRVGDVLLEGGLIQKKLSWDEYYTPAFIERINDFNIQQIVNFARSF